MRVLCRGGNPVGSSASSLARSWCALNVFLEHQKNGGVAPPIGLELKKSGEVSRISSFFYLLSAKRHLMTGSSVVRSLC